MRLAEEETRLGYVSGSDAAPTLPPTVFGALRSPQAVEGRWIRLLRPPERALTALEPTGARAQRRRTGSANAAPIAHPWRSGEAARPRGGVREERAHGARATILTERCAKFRRKTRARGRAVAILRSGALPAGGSLLLFRRLPYALSLRPLNCKFVSNCLTRN